MATLSNKTNTVAWMVSHCDTNSRREEYARQLQKLIQVDVFGECGNISCPRNGTHWISSPECYEMIGRKYKFYLSFENSFCDDYGMQNCHSFTLFAHYILDFFKPSQLCNIHKEVAQNECDGIMRYVHHV